MILSLASAFMAVLLASAWNVRAAQPCTVMLRGAATALNPTGQALGVAGVNLKLSGTSAAGATFSTVSGSDGSYQFVGLSPGPYTLQASLPGFKTIVKRVTITGGATVVEALHLELEELR